jgi:hypothetical protein
VTLQFNYDRDVGPSGVGVTWQSLFFSPGKPSARVPGQGAGPALLLPTVSEPRLALLITVTSC